MNEYRYRTCRRCGKKWNVSVKAENVKKYICPVCHRKNKNNCGAFMKGDNNDS